ncbi:MAG: DegQ family serine endoprotease [Candidatus Dadabacteria bacterium]|nr:DegQ family serine endoprotease [Candidatus Dadabacteria bacterium]
MRLTLILPFLLLAPLVITSCTRKEEKKTKGENNRIDSVRDMPILPPALPSFTLLVKKLKPSVVNISTTSVIGDERSFEFPSPHGERGNPFQKLFRGFRQRELGSGFIISEDGYIITNSHVIEKADEIQVTLENEKRYIAKIVGGDSKTDLALLKIDTRDKLTPAMLGNSDKLEIGNWILAIGNPFGLGHTVTAGIVSAKGRILGLGDYDDFIQTDAPINHGNSGGPLFNLEGEVVGVTSTVLTRAQGIGFAVPINFVKQVIEQLRGNGRVERGWLGVVIQDLTPEIAEVMRLPDLEGALVGDVTSGSPADKAGVKKGDVILEFNGQKIKENGELSRGVSTKQPGTEVELKLLRDGMEKTLSVKLGAPSSVSTDMAEVQSIQGKLGLTVKELSLDATNRLRVEEDAGVIVTKVDSGSPGGKAGFQIGDVIIEVNRKRIRTSEEYMSMINLIEKGQTTLFLVKRKDVTLYISMRF